MACNICVNCLKASSDDRKVKLVQLFGNAADTYGQKYVLRDIGIHTKKLMNEINSVLC